MKKSVRLYLEGVVQGVFFRAFIKENADKNNVRGFIRNLENGEIEIFLEGDIDSVNRMIGISREGPKHSKIKKVEIKEEKFQDLKEFKVLHI
jgi:acylphosphatase